MKTCWEFVFSSSGTTFSKKYKFTGKANPLPEHSSTCSPFDFTGEIIPHEFNDPAADDTGKILITLVGTPEETEGKAFTALNHLTEKMSYPNGRIHVHQGFILGKRIPETPEEEKEIGDTPFFAKLSFQEYSPPPEFDPKNITCVDFKPSDFLILQQYNAARELKNPIDRFLAFFKVLEKLFADERGGNVFQLLLKNSELLKTFKEIHGNEVLDKEKIIQKWMIVRDNCAHLRGSTGYSQSDSRIKTEILPNLNMIEVILGCYLQKRFNSDKEKHENS